MEAASRLAYVPQPDLPLWHVTVTVAGPEIEVGELRSGLRRLVQQRPFVVSARYAAGRVEVRYWDEAENVDDAASLGLRLWFDHRDAAGLPDWTVVGLEVVDRATVHERVERGEPVPSPASVLGEVRPL